MNGRKRDIIILAATGIAFIILIGVYGAINIQYAPAFTLVLYAGLIVVTMFYAYYSMEIARATRQQADASVKMARTMTQPMLMPYLRLISDFDTDRYVRFEAGVDNNGNGPAYDVRGEIQDEGKPAGVLATGDITSVLRGHDRKQWLHPDPRLYFPKSDKVQRRFFIIKYKDIGGTHEICRPFVLRTGENDKPFADLERPSRRILHKENLEDELP